MACGEWTCFGEAVLTASDLNRSLRHVYPRHCAYAVALPTARPWRRAASANLPTAPSTGTLPLVRKVHSLLLRRSAPTASASL